MQHDTSFVDRWFCRVCDSPVLPETDSLFIHLCDLNPGGECGEALLHGECVATWLTAVREVFMRADEEVSRGLQNEQG